MAGKRSNKNSIKHCPLIDEKCLKSGCQLYHEDFDRCLIDLLAFNVYSLAAEMRKFNDKEE